MAGEKQIPEAVRQAVSAEINDLCLREGSDRAMASKLGVSNETIRKARAGDLGPKVVDGLLRVTGERIEDIVRRRGGAAVAADIPQWMKHHQAPTASAPMASAHAPAEPRYAYLPAALLFAKRKGKTYDDRVIEAAKALVFRGEEPDPEGWERLLDSQKRLLSELDGGRSIGVPIKQSDVAKPPQPKKRR